VRLVVTKSKKKRDESKSKDSDKEFLFDYWELEYPEEYVEELIAQSVEVPISKVAGKLTEVDLSGKLCETKDGFVYLDVPNAIIDGFMPLIGEEVKKPPYNNKDFGSVGAHISVIGDSEREDNGIDKIKEIGKEFSFRVKGLFSTKPDGWDEMKKVWFLTVHSEELEKLRKDYGLSPLKKNHDFHITLAVQEK
jgi:hypothetical protein